MDETKEPELESAELNIDLNVRALDPETLQILIDDKIATGG